MSNQDETIKHIFSLGRLSRKYEVCKDDNCYFTLQTLFILTATYWVFMVLLGGIVIPGGLFMPSIMVMPSLPTARHRVLHSQNFNCAVAECLQCCRAACIACDLSPALPRRLQRSPFPWPVSSYIQSLQNSLIGVKEIHLLEAS